MASLHILCFKPFNLRNKIMKIEHKKYFMAHQYMPEIFHGPYKNPTSPSPSPLSYILNVWSLKHIVINDQLFMNHESSMIESYKLERCIELQLELQL